MSFPPSCLKGASHVPGQKKCHSGVTAIMPLGDLLLFDLRKKRRDKGGHGELQLQSSTPHPKHKWMLPTALSKEFTKFNLKNRESTRGHNVGRPLWNGKTAYAYASTLLACKWIPTSPHFVGGGRRQGIVAGKRVLRLSTIAVMPSDDPKYEGRGIAFPSDTARVFP